MFNDVADKVFIDQAFSLLAGIHQALSQIRLTRRGIPVDSL